MLGVPQAGEADVLAGVVGKEAMNHLCWRTGGAARLLVPGHEPAVLYKDLVLLMVGIILGGVL